jgi:PHD/YefM family antitoxin component YafN of YafNO toxin-antitoxin module
MHVSNEETRTTREVAREVNSILDALANGDVEKIVIMNRTGKIAGVIISPQRYDTLSQEN